MQPRPDADPASVARRVADLPTLAIASGYLQRYAKAATASGDSSMLASSIRAFLPILDAVAAGRKDEGRVERWARGLVAAEGLDPDYRITAEHHALWVYSQGTARAATALADAERAAEERR